MSKGLALKQQVLSVSLSSPTVTPLAQRRSIFTLQSEGKAYEQGEKGLQPLYSLFSGLERRVIVRDVLRCVLPAARSKKLMQPIYPSKYCSPEVFYREKNKLKI